MSADVAHLEPVWSDRGFKHMPEIEDSQGRTVQVYESSRADAPHVWLSVGNNDTPDAFVGLTLEEAGHLRDQLTYLIATHYQLEGGS